MDLKRCEGCCPEAPSPEGFTRWQDSTALYHWVQCGDAPACKVGPCCSTQEEADAGWNKLVDAENEKYWKENRQKSELWDLCCRVVKNRNAFPIDQAKLTEQIIDIVENDPIVEVNQDETFMDGSLSAGRM